MVWQPGLRRALFNPDIFASKRMAGFGRDYRAGDVDFGDLAVFLRFTLENGGFVLIFGMKNAILPLEIQMCQ